MSITIKKKYIECILLKVAVNLQVKEFQYEEKEFVDIAQNYFGTLVPITLTITENNHIDNIQIVLKLAPTDDKYRVSGAITTMFAREIFMYTKVLSAYGKLQESFPTSKQYIIPKLYFVCDEYCKEAIVLENMCFKGFKPYINSMFLDLNHIEIALQSLAKFHALSIILQEKDITFYNQIKDICIPLTENTNKRFMDIMRDRLRKAKKVFTNTVYEPQLDILLDNCAQLIENASTKVKCTCICHGDIWKENILFNYEEETPKSSCLIDYQTSRMCSPAFDVLYLIFSSTNSELRSTHFSHLLDAYYETMTQSLALANIDERYPRELFNYDLKIVGPSCFIVANTALWLASGLQEEGHVRSKIQLKTEEERLTALGSYRNIINNIMDDLTCYGFLQI